MSTSVADTPATVNANCAFVARMSFTSCSPSAECGSMSETTESQVPCSPGSGSNRLLSSFGTGGRILPSVTA